MFTVRACKYYKLLHRILLFLEVELKQKVEAYNYKINDAVLNIIYCWCRTAN